VLMVAMQAILGKSQENEQGQWHRRCPLQPVKIGIYCALLSSERQRKHHPTPARNLTGCRPGAQFGLLWPLFHLCTRWKIAVVHMCSVVTNRETVLFNSGSARRFTASALQAFLLWVRTNVCNHVCCALTFETGRPPSHPTSLLPVPPRRLGIKPELCCGVTKCQGGPSTQQQRHSSGGTGTRRCRQGQLWPQARWLNVVSTHTQGQQQERLKGWRPRWCVCRCCGSRHGCRAPCGQRAGPSAAFR